jgi:zinc/manganese transport system substrate-binding protein
MWTVRVIASLVAVALALAGCGSAQPAAPATPGPAVVTSTNVYGAVARAVGGDRITVTSLIDDPAADPHSYESTPADALAVSDARIVVRNGGGYDDFMTRLIESGGGQQTVIDVTTLSGLAGAAGAGEFNEHLWYHLPTVATLATTLATDLGAADPAGSATYTAGAEAFTAKVAELERKAAAIGTAAPGATVAVTEPLPGHLIATAGLTDLTPQAFTEAIEEDTDPPAAVVQETLALFSGPRPVRAVILNAQTQTPVTDQVRRAAQAAGVPVVEMTETLPEGTMDYVTWMGAQIDALGTAVAAGAP